MNARVVIGGAIVAVLAAGCGSTTRIVEVHTVTRTVTVTQTAASNPAREILPPAAIPPKVDECSEQLSIGADGNAGPTTCSHGRLNSLAWNYFAKGNPLVMALGPDATPDEITIAMCADLAHGSTIPIETSAYDLAALYDGWSFGINPASDLANADSCSAHA